MEVSPPTAAAGISMLPAQQQHRRLQSTGGLTAAKSVFADKATINTQQKMWAGAKDRLYHWISVINGTIK
jgi:hypothetical protein